MCHKFPVFCRVKHTPGKFWIGRLPRVSSGALPHIFFGQIGQNLFSPFFVANTTNLRRTTQWKQVRVPRIQPRAHTAKVRVRRNFFKPSLKTTKSTGQVRARRSKTKVGAPPPTTNSAKSIAQVRGRRPPSARQKFSKSEISEGIGLGDINISESEGTCINQARRKIR